MRITPASSPACLRVAYVFTCLCLIHLSGRSYNPDPGVLQSQQDPRGVSLTGSVNANTIFEVFLCIYIFESFLGLGIENQF